MTDVFDIANCFLCLQDEDCEDYISNSKLQKLCYYTQGHYLAAQNERLFVDDIEAWQYGPTVPKVYRKYKEFKGRVLMASQDFFRDVFQKK